MRTIHRLACTPFLLVAAGCYTYTPTSMAEVAPGERLRARVSAVEAERLREVVPRGTRLLEGELLRNEGGEVLLLVPVADRESAGSGTTSHRRVTIPRRDIMEVEIKTLDRLRTGGMIAAGTFVAGLLVAGQLRDERIGDGPPNGDGGNQILVPVGFRLALPFPR